MEELKRDIEMYRQYEDFLKSVLTESEEFQQEEGKEEPDVNIIIGRYEQLKEM